MNILIIEDEKHNVSRLQRILTDISPTITVVGVLGTIKESVAWLQTSHAKAPDVILMDIRLSDGISFEIFDQVDFPYPIIFTTSYDEYAVQAFKVNSVDYLLKPIEKEELESALKKVTEINRSVHPDLEQLIQLFKKQTVAYRKRFLLPRVDGYKAIAVDDIDYIYSESKITNLVNRSGEEYILQQSLDEMEEQLDPDCFFRANRQFIVRIDSISSIQNLDNGKLKVILKTALNKDIVVSREKASTLKKWLDK